MAKKILLIDDEKDIVQIMRKQVQNAGYEAHVAYNGKEGLETAEDVHPHLVLTDISMPCMDGIMFYNELKSRHDLSHIPVIIVSAYGAHEEEMRKLGVKDYLIKPFPPQALLSKVASFFHTQKAYKVLIATKMLFLTKVILEESKDALQHLDVHLTNDQGTVADDALEIQPDLVLLDVDMFTAFSADGTVRYLRSKETLKETQILLMRTMAMPSAAASAPPVVEQCLASGASHYIGTLNRDILSSVVKEYCR